MAEYLQAPPRRKALGLLADALTSGQEALNTVNLPYVGGLGGLLFGQAPQYLQDVSYGMPLLRGGNVATGGLGTLTPDTRMLDVATLPFVGVGAAKAGQVGAKTLGKEVARQVETGTGILGSNVLDPRQYATAYHGSPAIFDKFDIKKVGTGEGAQAFGHGMYFAENPEVAKSYIPRDFKSEDKLSKLYDQAEKKGQYAAMQIYEDLMLHKMPNEISLEGFAGNELAQAQNALKQGTKIYQSQKGANLYKVDIPDEYMPSLLQWDKPLSQQPEKVKKALEKIDPDTYSPKGFDYSPEELGQSIYMRIANSPFAQNHQQASSLLDSIGIKGIKYLDEGSRTSQAGTNNFVIFDPSNVKIIERNNKGLLGKAPEVVDNAQGLLQSSTKLAPELKQPFIGYMTKDGFTEMFNHEAAKAADYHHSHLMKDPDKYFDDNALSFVRMGGENVFTVKGNAILDPYKKDSSKQLGLLAKKLINEGADPNAPFYVEDLALPKIEAPYQGKQIGTLQDWLKYTK